MNLSELEKILNADGVSVCEICGTPYTPRSSRQRTCGAPECKRQSHNNYLRERNRKLKEKDSASFNKYQAEANKKWRSKKRTLEKREQELNELKKHWEAQSEFDRKVTEYGDRYGEVSAQKVLATVPKIDVNLERRNEDGNLHTEVNRTGSESDIDE